MNDITKAAAKAVAKPDESLTRTAGKSVALTGVGGVGLVALAGLIPFVGVLGLSMALVIVGVLLFVFGS